jgi:chain length determinant protein EpsF
VESDKTRTITFRDLLLVLQARRKVASFIFGSVLLLCIVLTFILPTQYTATSSVVIDLKSDPLAGAGATALTEQIVQSYVTTEVDIIASQRVALRVVKQLGLEKDPEMMEKWRKSQDSWLNFFGGSKGDIGTWIANYLLEKRLRVSPSRDSNVILIAVKWSSAAGAAQVANAFARAAIDTNIELKVEPAKLYAGWFDERAKALRADLAEKQKRLSDFQLKVGMVATDDKLDVENARLTELSTGLVAIQAELQESQSRQRQIGGNNESLPEVLQSPLIANLKNDLADAEAKKADVAARVGKNHPDYQAAEATVSNLRSRLEQETAKIVASLGNANQVNVRREADLQKAFDAQKERVLELKHAHDQAAILESDVAAAQRDLDAVNQRFAQSSLESQTQQTNIVQLSYAVPPLESSSPKLLLNLALGIVFGGSLAFAAVLLLELRDRRVRDDDAIQQLLDMPILARIGLIEIEEELPPAMPRLGRAI